MKTVFRQALDSFQHYRQTVQPLTDDGQALADLSSQRSINAAGRSFMNFAEALVYGSKYDGVAKMAIKARKSPVEFLAYDTMADIVKDLRKEAAEEAGDGGQDPPPAVGGTDPSASVAGLPAATPVSDVQSMVALGQSVTLAAVVEADVLKALAGTEVAEDDCQELLRECTREATRNVDVLCSFLSQDGLSETQLADVIKGTPAAKEAGRVLILMDQKLAGETRTAPHIRQCPLNEEQSQRWLAAACRSRSATSTVELQPDDVVLLPDAGKHGRGLSARSW